MQKIYIMLFRKTKNHFGMIDLLENYKNTGLKDGVFQEVSEKMNGNLLIKIDSSEK